MLRHSPLFHFNHGNHVCVFYRTADALREVLIPYLAEGLRRGERCLCAQNPDLCKQIIYDLRFLGIDTDGAIRRGALEVHTVDEVYFPNKKFEPEKMIELLLRSMEEAWRSGFTALRTAGELSWAAEGRAECDQLLSYEKLVEQIFPANPPSASASTKWTSFLQPFWKVSSTRIASRCPIRPTESFTPASAFAAQIAGLRSWPIGSSSIPATTMWFSNGTLGKSWDGERPLVSMKRPSVPRTWLTWRRGDDNRYHVLEQLPTP